MQPNQIIDALTKQSVRLSVGQRRPTPPRWDGEKADLLIGYQISIQQEKQWNAYGTGGMRWGGGMATAQQSTISTGMLVLDMYDPTTKQLVWTGRVSGPSIPSANQGPKQKNLDKAMQKLLKSFPPKRR